MTATAPASEARIRVRATLRPWHHGLVYVGAVVLGLAMLVVGVLWPDTARWAAHGAWVPPAAVVPLVLHWQRRALRSSAAAARSSRTGP